VKYYPTKKTLKALGSSVRKLRREQKLSQEQLSFETGIPRKQIIRIEKGEVNTSIGNLLIISKVLDVHIGKLFEFEY
jgi:transcriptional regulator with XRE-family HTH domain